MLVLRVMLRIRIILVLMLMLILILTLKMLLMMILLMILLIKMQQHMSERTHVTDEQGKIELLSLWTVGRLRFAINMQDSLIFNIRMIKLKTMYNC